MIVSVLKINKNILTNSYESVKPNIYTWTFFGLQLSFSSIGYHDHSSIW